MAKPGNLITLAKTLRPINPGGVVKIYTPHPVEQSNLGWHRGRIPEEITRPVGGARYVAVLD
jgi:hypothetical protein